MRMEADFNKAFCGSTVHPLLKKHFWTTDVLIVINCSINKWIWIWLSYLQRRVFRHMKEMHVNHLRHNTVRHISPEKYHQSIQVTHSIEHWRQGLPMQDDHLVRCLFTSQWRLVGKIYIQYVVSCAACNYRVEKKTVKTVTQIQSIAVINPLPRLCANVDWRQSTAVGRRASILTEVERWWLYSVIRSDMTVQRLQR